MKAHEIFMYLLVFNIGFSLVSGLALFFSVHQDFTVELTLTAVETAVAGLAVYAVINYFSNKTQPSPQNYVYGIYGTVFLVTFMRTTSVFLTLANFLPLYAQGLFKLIFIAIFGGLSAWAFYFGMMQLVTGGWKAMK